MFFQSRADADATRTFLARSRAARWGMLTAAIQALLQLSIEVGVMVIHLRIVSQAATVPVDDASAGAPASPPPGGGAADTSPAGQFWAAMRLAQALTVYHVIYMLVAIFQFVVLAISVQWQNSVDLIAHMVLSAGLFGYSVMQLFQSKGVLERLAEALNGFAPAGSGARAAALAAIADAQRPGALPLVHGIAVVVACLFMLASLGLAYRLHQDYGWAMYRKIGASVQLRSQFLAYFVVVMLLKLNVFFYFTFALQYLVVKALANPDAPMLAAQVVGSVAVIAVMVAACVRAIRTENTKLMILFFVGGAGVLFFFGYMLSRVLGDTAFAAFNRSLTFAIAVNLVLALCTLATAWKCYQNFGQGLIKYFEAQDRSSCGNSRSGGRSAGSAGGGSIDGAAATPRTGDSQETWVAGGRGADLENAFRPGIPAKGHRSIMS